MDDTDRWLKAARKTLDLDKQAPKTLEVRSCDSARFQAVYSFARYSLTQVGAGLLLHDRGHSFAALANVRVAFEHALVSQWIVLTEGSEVIVSNTIDKSHSRILKDLEPHAAEIPAELRPLLELPKAELLPSFETICRRFDRSGLLYTVYRSLTVAVHISGATIAEHASVDAKTGAITLHPHPRSKTPPNDFEMALGWSAVLAKTALEMLLEDSADLLRVADIACAAGLPHDLTLDDLQPERQPTRSD
ncbi:hypothetical protein ACMHYT_22400 [Rhodococcus qingshengii]|uniref:hypothetical protein n=1 Tax=Rhodococcus qingshengii TaxID=334542 RepID=UPI0039C02FAD